MDQINHVIVEITMDATETGPRFFVEKVTTQPGRCFEGAEKLLRASFECLCCKTGYVVLPLIMQTAPTRTEMEVFIAENDPTPIQQVVEHITEVKSESTLDEVVDSDEEPRQCDQFDDFKIEPELSLQEDLFETLPVENQAHLEEGDLVRTPSTRPLDEVIDANEEQKQSDGLKDSEMEADKTFPMEVDLDSVEMPQVEHPACAEQTSELEESVVLTPSEERSLKLQCLQSKVVVCLVRVDEVAKAVNGFFTCVICKSSFKHRDYFTKHMNIHLGIRYSCTECQVSFSRKFQLIQHKKLIHQSEFRICEVCRQCQTWTKAEYHLHLRCRHPEFRNKGFQPKVQNFNGVDFPCVYCEPQATFTSFEELQTHLGDTHDRSFSCTRCPKAWTRQINLNRHIDSVHEKKSLKCPNCDKVFAWEQSLTRHLHTHNMSEPISKEKSMK